MVDYLKPTSQVLDAAGQYYTGSAASEGGKYQAQQYYHNAKLRMLSGSRQAAGIRKAGIQQASDVKVSMIAQGGGVNSEMLARLKKQSDIDAINTMYDAKADATMMREQGKQLNRQAKREYRAGVLKAGSSIVSAASSYNWGSKPSSITTTKRKYNGRYQY